MANRGDQYALSGFPKIGINLRKGTAILIQLFNPELIILGGKIAEAKEYITISIQQSINKYYTGQLIEKTETAFSNLVSDADILRSVVVVMERIFKEQTI